MNIHVHISTKTRQKQFAISSKLQVTHLVKVVDEKSGCCRWNLFIINLSIYNFHIIFFTPFFKLVSSVHSTFRPKSPMQLFHSTRRRKYSFCFIKYGIANLEREKFGNPRILSYPRLFNGQMTTISSVMLKRIIVNEYIHLMDIV